MPEPSQPLLFDRLAHWREALERAVDHTGGTHTFDDIAAGVLTGRYLLWDEGDAVAVLEVVTYPRKRALHVFLAGGNLQTIKEALPKVSAYARELGCDHMTMTGRAGWGRALAPLGWSVEHQNMRLELNE